ncbi:hypothetical protein Bca4012_103381 [Brassica carinata]
MKRRQHKGNPNRLVNMNHQSNGQSPRRPGNRRGLDRPSLSETNVLSRTRIASSHRHNISASEIPANILFTFASSAYFMQRRKDHKCRLLCSRLPHGRSIREQHFKQSLTIPQDRYATQAPDRVNKHKYASERTEKDSWSVVAREHRAYRH